MNSSGRQLQDRAITKLISRAQSGDANAAAELLPLVYEELRTLAHHRMAGERAGHTLQATALVHEAFIKLLGEDQPMLGGRRQFFHAAARAMRQILIDHSRQRNAIKRGGDWSRSTLHVADLAADDEKLGEFLALDEAMCRLEEEDSRAAEVVRLRFYAGLSIEETAEAMETSPRTIKRDWTFARARLLQLLQSAD